MKRGDYTKEEALTMLMQRCSVAEKCCHDLVVLLLRWGVPEKDHTEIINSLKNYKFVDDERFARLYVKDKSRFNSWGGYKIRQMLRSKKISEDTINLVLEQELNENMQSDKLTEMLKKKMAGLKYSTRYELKSKLLKYGYSKGFSYDLLVDIIDKILPEGDDFD